MIAPLAVRYTEEMGLDGNQKASWWRPPCSSGRSAGSSPGP